MTHTQYLATITSDTAGLLRLPSRISDDERRHLLAMAWKAPAAIEWRVQ